MIARLIKLSNAYAYFGLCALHLRMANEARGFVAKNPNVRKWDLDEWAEHFATGHEHEAWEMFRLAVECLSP